jgi:hypothetical protein
MFREQRQVEINRENIGILKRLQQKRALVDCNQQDKLKGLFKGRAQSANPHRYIKESSPFDGGVPLKTLDCKSVRITTRTGNRNGEKKSDENNINDHTHQSAPRLFQRIKKKRELVYVGKFRSLGEDITFRVQTNIAIEQALPSRSS